MAIKWKIKKLAEARGMNISQLADASGMAYSSALDYWHGRARRIDLVTLERICEALGCTPAEVFEYLPGVKLEDQESLELEPAVEGAL